MGADKVDETRRSFLKKATATVGGVGVVATAVPFVGSLLPPAEAEAAGAPVKVDVKKLKPGEQLTVNWRGKPVWIIRRTKAMLDSLKEQNELRDPSSEVAQQPKYARNEYRSRNPEYLVVVGICTHLGCSPTYRPEPKAIDEAWEGGFFCSCHGSKFDLAGRVYKGVPAPINLEVPPYTFLDKTVLLIGADTATAEHQQTEKVT